MAHFYAAGTDDHCANELISTEMLEIFRKLPDTFHILASVKLINEDGELIREIDWVVIPENRMGGIVIIEEKRISSSVILTNTSLNNDWEIRGRYNESFRGTRRNGVIQINSLLEMFKERLLQHSKLLFGCSTVSLNDLFVHKVLYLLHNRSKAIYVETTSHTNLFQGEEKLLDFLRTCQKARSLPTTELQARNIAWVLGLHKKESINGIDLSTPTVTFKVPREKAHLIASLIEHLNE